MCARTRGFVEGGRGHAMKKTAKFARRGQISEENPDERWCIIRVVMCTQLFMNLCPQLFKREKAL